MSNDRDLKLKDFSKELAVYALDAEHSLQKVEADPHGNSGEFGRFSQVMIAIRGTSVQLGLPAIAEMAGLGEEISIKLPTVQRGSQIKKGVSALWDALTTLKFMLENPSSESSEEQGILKHRLQATLKSLGGARETVSDDEIAKLLRGEV